MAAGAEPTLSVEVVDGATSAAAGLGEIAFVVSVDSAATLPAELDDVGALVDDTTVRFSVDFSAFVDEYGADWARRLRVARFGECALARLAGCSPQFAGEFVNDVDAGTISFDVPMGELMPAGPLAVSSARDSASGSEALTAADGGGTMGFAMLAGASGAGGDYATTSLNPTGSWAVGTQSGGFTWSYPVSMPAPPAGSAPGLAVSYSAAAIDGLTSDQNTQGGVLGPGWTVGDGFIERQYRPCGADGGLGADFCWAWDNATFSFAGMNSDLVHVANESSGQTGWEAKVYRLERHAGWKVVRYRSTNLTTARGSFGVDNDLEYWVATAPEGTRYWFGYGQEAGAFTPGTVLDSVQTVPVVGNHSGEPCNTLANNWCHQAYRWSLDRIEDANGRVITFDYIQELNHFGIRGTPGWSEPYVSASVLERIEYGQLAANASVANVHTNEVTFGYQWRCNDPVDGVCSGQPTGSNGSRYPDIPVDQFCATDYCTNYAPTFFHQRKLVSVTTKARSAAGAIVNVAQELMFYSWVEADGPTSDRLWLDRIQHRGLAGGDIYMPSVRFGRSPAMANRVDYNTAGGVTQMFYYRVGSILDEYGSEIRIAYTRPRACSSGSLPNWTSNSWACFPRWWTPPSGPAGFAAWHRWVVDSVVVVDQSGDLGATTKVVDYAYPEVVSGRALNAGRRLLGGAAGETPRFLVDSAGRVIDRLSVGTGISPQRQARHLAGSVKYDGGGYFNSVDDAQAVLDAFHDGSAEVLGVSASGNIVVRVPSVTGFNHNVGAGYLDQPTDDFFIKGSSSVSVVPAAPTWSP